MLLELSLLLVTLQLAEAGKDVDLTSEQIIMIAMGFMCFLIPCVCCLIKALSQTGPTKTENTDIGPVDQRLLPGQQPSTFASSHRTYNHTSFGNASLDRENNLMYPNINQPRRNVVTVHVTHAEIPPPAYVRDFDERMPPPSYESLFNPVVTHSSYSTCSK